MMVTLAAAPPTGADPAVPAVDTGAVESSPPATLVTPDGARLTVAAKDESQQIVQPLTTSTASRDFVVGGTFTGSVVSGSRPRNGGTLEVGYQVGCGIETGFFGVQLQAPRIDQVRESVHPGQVTLVPVATKQFKGTESRITITHYDMHIDNCVGQSFIRSYATLTVMTDSADDVVSYVGVTRSE